MIQNSEVGLVRVASVSRFIVFVCVWVGTLGLGLNSTPTLAQHAGAPGLSVISSQGEISDIDPESKKALEGIKRRWELLEKMIATKKNQIDRSEKYAAARAQEQLYELETKLRHLRQEFINTVVGLELSSVEDHTPSEKRDLYQEALKFIEPLFDAVRRVSEKPRRIEGYRNEIARLDNRLSLYKQAVERIEQVQSLDIDADFKRRLEESQTNLINSRQEVEENLISLKRKLNLELANHQSVGQVASEKVSGFFKKEGLSLFLSLSILIALLAGFNAISGRVFKVLEPKLKGRPIEKTIHTLYYLFATLISVVCVMIVLYLRSDLFLLALLILVGFGLAWTSKEFLRVFVKEIKLVLNLGPVRQGERVIWQGLPWKVKRLGFVSKLVNPAFPNIVLRVPSTQMLGLVSRASEAFEPWFPTLKGDYVGLQDGEYGFIKSQSPDEILLSTELGEKYYTVSSFLGKDPQNYSKGFACLIELKINDPHAFTRTGSAMQELYARLRGQVEESLKTLLPLGEGKDVVVPEFELTITPWSVVESKLRLVVACRGEWARDQIVLKHQFHGGLMQCWLKAQQHE